MRDLKVISGQKKGQFSKTQHVAYLARTANRKGEIKHSALYTEIQEDAARGWRSAEELKLFMCTADICSRWERQVLSIIARHLSEQHSTGTPWHGNRQQRHPLAHSRINKMFFLFWTVDGGSVQDVRYTLISYTVSYSFMSI